MAQDPSGLTQGAGGIASTLQKWINRIPTPGYKPSTPKPDTSWHDKQVSEANAAFRKQAQSSAPKPKPSVPKAKPSTFKKGGMVQKTGMAKVHKGEKVLTAKQVKASKKRGK